MGFGDFFYYTLLKHGKIIIAILGLIVAILVYFYMKKFGISFKEITIASVKYCEEDIDCFEHCGECVSIKSTKKCEKNLSIKCVCINNRCERARGLVV